MEEEDDMLSFNERLNLEKSKGILFPDSSFRAFWDMIVFVCVIYSSILLPIQISYSFVVPNYLQITDIISDVVFMLDISLNFCTGIFDKVLLIMSRNLIIKKYLSYWFWLDILSSFPY